jgi:hypothetical protein
MRTLLVGVLALGLVAILAGAGCEEQAQKPTTTPKVETPKTVTTPVAPKTSEKGITAPASTMSARAVAPKGPSVPPAAGKAVAGKTVIRVDCGARQAYTDKNSVVWSADQAYNATRKWGYVSSAGDVASHPMEALDALYGTERWGMTSYRFDVPDGKYTVRLHFAEIYELIAAPGIRIFTVSLQGKPVLEKFDITKDAGGFGKVVVKEFKDVAVTDGKLVIGFEKIAEFPTIQAIEVLGQ